MAAHASGQRTQSHDPFRMYDSPVGAKFLQKANKIFEDFPVSKYILFSLIFASEIAIVFAFAIYLAR
jgi:hypothetical protein